MRPGGKGLFKWEMKYDMFSLENYKMWNISYVTTPVTYTIKSN